MRQISPKTSPCQIPAGQQGGHQQRDRLLVAMAVRMARAALGWSQSELGQFLGMSQRAIHRIEQGHSEPRRTTLLAIETLLGKAGLKIEDRSDGGFGLIVPESMLGDAGGTMDVAAPSLANFSSVSDESEAVEPVRQGRPELRLSECCTTELSDDDRDPGDHAEERAATLKSAFTESR